VVSDNHPFWKLKHAVHAKFIGVTLIALYVPRVGIDEQVADVQNAFGAQYPRNLSEQPPLIIIAGYTSQQRKQEHCVEGPITKGQRQSVVSNQRQARELRTAPREHLFRKIRAYDVAVAGPQKLIKYATVSTPVVGPRVRCMIASYVEPTAQPLDGKLR
jgi:hypothetical protein